MKRAHSNLILFGIEEAGGASPAPTLFLCTGLKTGGQPSAPTVSMKFSLPLYYSLFVVLYSLSSCANKYDLAHAGPELEAYAKQHPENRLILKTDKGTIEAELHKDTPLHRANLVRLVKMGFYDGEGMFHRIVRSFVIQAGAPGVYEPTFLIPAEIDTNQNDTLHCHLTGAIGQAHRDTPENKSNSSDFYIVEGHGVDTATLEQFSIRQGTRRFAAYRRVGGAPELDGKYTVYGRVTKGMDVVVALAATQVRDEKPLQKVPVEVSIENEK